MRAVTRFFRSVAGKLFLALALCVVVLLLFNHLLNSFAFRKYYEREQSTVLVEVFHAADEAVQNRQDVGRVLSSYVAEHGISATVWSGYRLLYSNDTRLANNMFATPEELTVAPGEYTVSVRAASPQQGGEQRLWLLGKTNGGINVMLWVSLAGMGESTAIVNRFLWWSALATLLCGFVGVFFMARSFTRPVRRLSDMARRMVHLDFSARYTENGSHDELAELGNSLNTVSHTMEQNLSALKTANARLLADMEQKTRRDEARTRFIRNVSHELKTPLSLIQNYAEGLHENAADDAAARELYCSVIEEEAQKLSVILNKLTLLMQLESGKEELQIEQFDMAQLATRLLARYAPLFEERGVALPVVSHTPLRVWGDAALMENVLTNFVTNALHHVSEGGEIRLTLQETEHRTVRMTVFNTGAPIPQEDLPHVWESFYKVDKARTREYGGTGIGLSVVAAIMQAHHMPYGVQNTTDGVAFFVELPTE